MHRLVVLLVLVVLAGCGGADDPVRRAIETAEGEVSGGRAVLVDATGEVDAEDAPGVPVLRVTVAGDDEAAVVTVSDDGKDVVDTGTPDGAPRRPDGDVSLADAIETAESESQDGTLRSAGPAEDGGGWTVSYAGRTSDDSREITVDAASGEIAAVR